MAKKTETEKTLQKKDEKTKAVAKTSAKKEKKIKLVPAKKLPGFYRKKFSEKDFEKKVLKRIYIDADKKLVESQFKQETNKKGRAVMVFDRTSEIAKNDFLRCKKIALDVKNQKFGIKFVPLLAVVCLVAGIGVAVTLFKNIVIEKGLTAAMQGIFGAKTDIQKVDLQIFGASLEIDGLAQANPDSPMKNIFEIDKIDVAFNLTDLLRGKFHAKNIEVSGVAIDTERKKSGELARVKKSKKEKQVAAETKKDSDSIMNAAADQLKKMFESYNPETMLSNIQNELTSPAVANSIAEDVKTKVEKWKNVPNEYQASIAKLSGSVDSFVKTNWGNITNASTLKKAISDIETAMSESNSLKNKMAATSKEIKSDTNAINGYSQQLQAAVKADSKLVDSKIAEMKNLFSADGLKNILTEGVRGILLEKAGKFYPYIDKAMTAAMNSKGNSNSSESKQKAASEKAEKKSKKKAKSAGHARSAGRMVYYKKDTVPKLLIENVVASGYEYKSNELLFKGTASEISSDQNMRGKPAKINADFKVLGKPNKASIVIDARDSSSAPLVLADYSGKGYPISADAQVFNLSSAGDIDAVLKCGSDGSFSVGGTLNMRINEIHGMEFEPAKVSELYQKAISGIKALSVGFNVLYRNGGMEVELTNIEKLSKQLAEPVIQALTGELNSIAAEAQANITKVLSEKTGVATDQIAAFTDISTLLNGQINSVNNMQKQLEEQKAKINKQLSNAAKGAAVDALKKLF